MHHYSTTTCGHMPGGQSQMKKSIWSVDIPQLAFHSDLVLSALLGISALHLSGLKPDDHTLVLSARHYFDRAVSQHRMALSNVKDHNAEAILATAILICHHTWLASHSTSLDEPYVLPLQTYHMARGIQALLGQMWPSLREESYLTCVEQGAKWNDCVPSHYDPFLMSVQQDLDVLSRTFEEDGVTPEVKEVYDKAVLEITSICYAISNGGKFYPLVLVPKDFPIVLRHSLQIPLPHTVKPGHLSVVLRQSPKYLFTRKCLTL